MAEFVILIIVNLLLVCLFLFFAVQFYNLTFRGFAPFISSRPYVIKAVLKELKLKDEARVYELGSGRAGFLRAIEDNYRTARLVGVEYSLFPFFIAQLQISLAHSKIKLRRENIFKTDINDANVVYCYLNINTMKQLKEKFERDCRPGTQIVSYMFRVPDWEADKIVEIPERKGEKIYFYKV